MTAPPPPKTLQVSSTLVNTNAPSTTQVRLLAAGSPPQNPATQLRQPPSRVPIDVNTGATPSAVRAVPAVARRRPPVVTHLECFYGEEDDIHLAFGTFPPVRATSFTPQGTAVFGCSLDPFSLAQLQQLQASARLSIPAAVPPHENRLITVLVRPDVVTAALTYDAVSVTAALDAQREGDSSEIASLRTANSRLTD